MVSPRGDDLDGVPAIHLEVAREMFLVGDAPASQHTRLASLPRSLKGRHVGATRLWVDPGVDGQAIQCDQIAHVGCSI